MANKKKKISVEEAIQEVASQWAELSMEEGVESLINQGRDIADWEADRMSESDLAKFESSWFDVLERASSDKRYKGMLQSQAVESMQEIARMMAIGLVREKVFDLQKEEEMRLRKESQERALESVKKLTRMRDLVVAGTQFEDIFQELSQLLEKEEEVHSSKFHETWNVFREAWPELGYEILVQAHVSMDDFTRVYNDASDRLLEPIGMAFRDHPLLPLWMDDMGDSYNPFLGNFSLACFKKNLYYIENNFEDHVVRITLEVIDRMDLKSLYGEGEDYEFYIEKLDEYVTDVPSIRIQCTASYLLAKAFHLGERRGINVLERILDD